MIRLKRVYDVPSPDDGFRVLVDRLWPRGMTRESACLDAWEKDIAPSAELRKTFHRDMARWDEFRRQYRSELDTQPELVARLRGIGSTGNLTLVYASKDPEHNHALVLKEYLESR